MRRFSFRYTSVRQALALLACVLLFAACDKDDESFPEINVSLETPASYRYYLFEDTVFIKGSVSSSATISKVELSFSDDSFNPLSEVLVYKPKTKTFEADTFLVLKDPTLRSGDYVVQFKVYADGFQQRDYTVVAYQEELLELDSWMYGESTSEGTTLYSKEGLDFIPFKDFDYQTDFAQTIPEKASFLMADPTGVRSYNYLTEFQIWEKSSSELFTGFDISAYTFYEEEFYFGAQENQIRKLGYAGNSIATYDIALNFNLMHMTAFKDHLFTAVQSVVGDQYQMVVYYDPTSALQTVVNMDVYGKPLAFFQRNNRFFYVLTEKDNDYRVYTYDIDANTLSLTTSTEAFDAKHFFQLDPNRFCMINDNKVFVYDNNTQLISTMTSVGYDIDHISFDKESGTLFLMDENHITQHNLYNNARVFDDEVTNNISFVIPVYNK